MKKMQLIFSLLGKGAISWRRKIFYHPQMVGNHLSCAWWREPLQQEINFRF